MYSKVQADKKSYYTETFCFIPDYGSIYYIGLALLRSKYTNPAKGILEFCRQKLTAPPMAMSNNWAVSGQASGTLSSLNKSS